MDEPLSVETIDIRHARGFHRARWVAVVFSLIAITGAVAFLIVTVQQQQKELDSSCGYWSLLGTLDPVSATSPHPGPALVTIIADSRNSYIGQGCAPALPPPSPHLLQWAAHYHLKVR